jgi:hypothetical protein
VPDQDTSLDRKPAKMKNVGGSKPNRKQKPTAHKLATKMSCSRAENRVQQEKSPKKNKSWAAANRRKTMAAAARTRVATFKRNGETRSADRNGGENQFGHQEQNQTAESASRAKRPGVRNRTRQPTGTDQRKSAAKRVRPSAEKNQAEQKKERARGKTKSFEQQKQKLKP